MDKFEGRRRRSRSEARRFWTMHLDDQHESGLGVAEYCRRHNLGAASFYIWRNRVAREASSALAVPEAGFREIVSQEQVAQVAGAAIEISSLRIRLADERLLGQVLSALMSS